jgi:hypothetical protein
MSCRTTTTITTTIIIIIIITTTISGTTAQMGASHHYNSSIAEVSVNEKQVASLLPPRKFQIILIQQSEPSGSEAGESQVRNRMGENFAYKASHSLLCRVLLHAVNLQHGTDGFTSPPKEVHATDFYHP